MKTVYAFLADGMEEVEALMVIDLLRRTKKLNVVTVSIKDELLVNEIDFSSGDCIFLPGGMPGTTNLGACEKLADEIVEYNNQGKLLAAICAAPTVFSNLGLLKDKNATSYPSFEDQMECNNYGGGVVRDGNFITGKGLGVALEMGLEIISYLVDEETAGEVAKAIQYDGVK